MSSDQETEIKAKNKGGRPRKAPDSTKSNWLLKNISNETKSAVKKASQSNEETIGAWVDRVLLQAAQEQFSASKAVDIPSDFAKQQIELLTSLAEKVDNLEKRSQRPFFERLFGSR
jgi:hypothetical protein